LEKFADINEVDRSPFYKYRGEVINITKLLEEQYKKYF
jgi:ACT domain-containing protein